MAHKKKKEKKPKRWQRARQTAQQVHTQKTQMMNKAATAEIVAMTKMANDPNVSAHDRFEARRRASRVPTLLARHMEKAGNTLERTMGRIDVKELNFSRTIVHNMERLEIKYRLEGHSGKAATQLARDRMVERMGADVVDFLPKPRRVRQDGIVMSTFMKNPSKLRSVRDAATRSIRKRWNGEYIEATFPDGKESKRRGGEMRRAMEEERFKSKDPTMMTKNDAKLLNEARKRKILDLKDAWGKQIDVEDDPIRRSDIHSRFAAQINMITNQTDYAEGQQLHMREEGQLGVGDHLRRKDKKRKLKGDRIKKMMSAGQARKGDTSLKGKLSPTMPDTGVGYSGGLPKARKKPMVQDIGASRDFAHRDGAPVTYSPMVDTRTPANRNRQVQQLADDGQSDGDFDGSEDFSGDLGVEDLLGVPKKYEYEGADMFSSQFDDLLM